MLVPPSYLSVSQGSPLVESRLAFSSGVAVSETPLPLMLDTWALSIHEFDIYGFGHF